MVSKTAARAAEIESTAAALASVQTECTELRRTISAQELSPEDIRRMNGQRTQIEAAHLQAVEAK